MKYFLLKASEFLQTNMNIKITPEDFEFPPNSSLGDLAFPCFKLAKEFRKAPNLISAESVDKLNLDDKFREFFKAKAVGPYVNLFIDTEKLINFVFDPTQEKFTKREGVWIFDYSAPNIAKPILVSTMRSTVIGAAMYRMASFLGYKAVGINHLGDWGRQYGLLYVGYQKYKETLPEKISVDDLIKIYVKIHQDMEEDPTILDQGKAAFLDLEAGGKEVSEFWKKARDVSLEDYKKVYNRLNITFDYYWGESHYIDASKELVTTLKKKGLLEESQGAQVVNVSDELGEDVPPAIIIKGDGSTIYATRDIAACIYRKNHFDFQKLTWVVGHEQSLHFRQVKAVLARMKNDWQSSCGHLAFGLYKFKGLKMSTRQGRFVTLYDVIETTKNEVRSLMESREGLSSKEIESNSEAVAIGAILFCDLSNDPAKDIDFDIANIIDFKGDTGPYIQYSLTRCKSLLTKISNLGIDIKIKPIDFSIWFSGMSKEERAIVIQLGFFEYRVERSVDTLKPSVLAQYLLGLAKLWNVFYRNHRIIDGSKDLLEVRVQLICNVRKTLEQGFALLGIPHPDKM